MSAGHITELQARPTVQALGTSQIRLIANAAMGLPDVLPFWFGESDSETPAFIRDAATQSLQRGETFYTENLGRPYLRQAIASYLSDLHGVEIGMDRVAVTGSGVAAIMLAAQMLVEPGDRIVAVTPVWPNVTQIPAILGAHVERIPLVVQGGRWTLDLDALLAALTPQTRMLLLNSPNNPTGWCIGDQELQVVLDHCRRFGIWILTDEVYERLIYGGDRRSAASLMPLYQPGDRIIGINSFSKAWTMTGWRVGWIVLPPALSGDLTKLIEYNTSCLPEFVQRAAFAAITEGEPEVARLKDRLTASRNFLVGALRQLDGVEIPQADGAMYAFFRLHGEADSLALAQELVRSVGLGLAPGVAFGSEADGWLRWCYATSVDRLAQGTERLSRFLDARKGTP